MEQNREPRKKPNHIWLTNFDESMKNIQWGKIVSSINGGVKTRYQSSCHGSMVNESD